MFLIGLHINTLDTNFINFLDEKKLRYFLRDSRLSAVTNAYQLLRDTYYY